MGDTGKLTKKQKKALAFRERKGKSRAKPGDAFDEDNAIPVAEDQTVSEVLQVESREVDEPEERSDPPMVQKQSKKRKRDENGAEEEQNVQSKKKKRKAGGSEAAGGEVEDEEEAVEAKPEDKKSKTSVKDQRFILFVGNLKYTTTAEAVREHFKLCDPPPIVRLRTPKPSETSKPTVKSKGFAFLEFDNKAALQQALKLHHSQLEGRNINVELTAGGGGKSEARTAKLKKRNKELHDQRVKRIQKSKSKSSATSKEDAEADLKPQRFSSTSGVDQAPATKRTWTIGTTPEENTKQRGKKKSKKPPRSQGTGVNAIPVG